MSYHENDTGQVKIYTHCLRYNDHISAPPPAITTTIKGYIHIPQFDKENTDWRTYACSHISWTIYLQNTFSALTSFYLLIAHRH